MIVVSDTGFATKVATASDYSSFIFHFADTGFATKVATASDYSSFIFHFPDTCFAVVQCSTS
jgi:hypothetical protein